MKYMIVFTLLFTSFFTQAQTADNPGTPEERAAKMTARMREELTLTLKQLPDVEALNLKYAKIMQAKVFDKETSKWEKYRTGTKINQQKEAELKPLLTPTQWKKYEKMSAKAKNQVWSKIF